MLKEKFEEAQAKKDNDINSFVWKGKKSIVDGTVVQETKKMMEASQEEIKGWLEKCSEMLYNNNKETPGRYILLNIIEDQRERCNAELFIRWLEHDKDTPKYVFMTALRNFLDNNPKIELEDGTFIDTKKASIAIAVGDCPKEFMSLSIELVLDACLDQLGRFSKQHLTLSFFLRQGIYLSPTDKQNIKPNMSKSDYVKQYLDIKANYDIPISHKGLTLKEMKAMISLPRSAKYSELSTVQLETLRNKILFLLEMDVRFHISEWEMRERQLKLVAKARGFNV